MISPTPKQTYEPRIWAGRVWTANGPRGGTPFAFKAPYGVYMNATQLLARSLATRQVLRFTIGPMTIRRLRKLDRRTLVRYEVAFAELSADLGVDWGA